MIGHSGSAWSLLCDSCENFGGAERDRTDDLLSAISTSVSDVRRSFVLPDFFSALSGAIHRVLTTSRIGELNLTTIAIMNAFEKELV